MLVTEDNGGKSNEIIQKKLWGRAGRNEGKTGGSLRKGRR